VKLARSALVVGLVAAFMFAGSPARADEDLKIGVIAALSGGGTAWGLGLQRGVQLALDEVNAGGGLKLDGKIYRLSLIAYDDQYNAAQAKIAVERLVQQDGVKFVMGPVGSPGALSSLAVTQPAQVLQFVDGYAPGILKNDFNAAYIFRVDNSNLEFSSRIVDWIKQTMPEVKKIGMIVPNDATGQAAVPTLVAAYKHQGFDVWVDYYERGTKEFTPVLLRMISQNIDLFDLNSASPGDAGLMVKQVRQVGFKGKVLQAGGAGVDEIMAIAGPLANGFIKYDVFDESDPQAKQLIAAYAKKFSGPMNGMVPVYYNATQILLEAMRRANSVDTTKVRDEVEKLQGWNTALYGPLRWGGKASYGNDHQIMLPFYMKQVDGKSVSVKATLQPAD
jgi:branched-chain amino acid transport system substrate-binding protein